MLDLRGWWRGKSSDFCTRDFPEVGYLLPSALHSDRSGAGVQSHVPSQQHLWVGCLRCGPRLWTASWTPSTRGALRHGRTERCITILDCLHGCRVPWSVSHSATLHASQQSTQSAVATLSSTCTASWCEQCKCLVTWCKPPIQAPQAGQQASQHLTWTRLGIPGTAVAVPLSREEREVLAPAQPCYAERAACLLKKLTGLVR